MPVPLTIRVQSPIAHSPSLRLAALPPLHGFIGHGVHMETAAWLDLALRASPPLQRRAAILRQVQSRLDATNGDLPQPPSLDAPLDRVVAMPGRIKPPPLQRPTARDLRQDAALCGCRFHAPAPR